MLVVAFQRGGGASKERLQISVIRQCPELPESAGVQHTDSWPVGWIPSRRDFEPEAKSPVPGAQRDAGQACLGGLRGSSPETRAADARQGIVSFPRHPEERLRCGHSTGSSDGGPKKQAASVRPRCRGSGRPRHRACTANFQRLGGGQINLGADAQPRRRYDFISRRTTVCQTAPAGSGSILSHAAREAHELKSPPGSSRPPAAGVGGGVVRASPACPVPACPLGTG